MKIAVIGAGAAGCIAAIKASEGAEVIILEKKDSIGNKLKITGKGRCNLTFKGDFEYFQKNILENGKFMYSSFNLFSNENLIEFVNKLGVKTKEERGNRIFLENDNALELVLAVKQKLKKSNVKIEYNFDVKSVEKFEEKFIITSKENKIIEVDKCIIATGGKSYPGTGSTGDGYKIAEKSGHTINQIKPGLVRIKSSDVMCKNMQGLTLKNVKLIVTDNDKVIFEDFGEMMFSHFGITGPIVLSASSKITRIKELESKIKKSEIKIYLDLKPALTEEVLDKRICRDFEKYINKEFKNSLSEL